MLDPEYYCGSDTRDLTGTPRSLEAVWWSAYRTAQRYGEGAQYLAWSRPQIHFAALVTEAEREGAA